MQSGHRAGKKRNQFTCFPELISLSSAKTVRRLTAVSFLTLNFTLLSFTPLILPPVFAQPSGHIITIPEDFGSGRVTPEDQLSRYADPSGSNCRVKVFTTSFWQERWTYLIYLAIGLGVLAGIRKYEITQIRLKNQVRIANIETSKLKELDQLRSQFFANLSHEFRTPLTLIKGPVEQLIEEDTDLQRRRNLKMIHANTTRLLQLINQLLDLSRIESGNYNIKAGTGDIRSLVKGLAMSFASLAD